MMASSMLLSLLTSLLLTSQLFVAAKNLISQIPDGQVQAGPSAVSVLDTTMAGTEGTSTTSETLTASMIVSIAPINTTAAVAALPSTIGSLLPTSILVAAPAGAPGAASNYTGLQTLAAIPNPSPHVPVPLNGTILPSLGAFNGTSAAATSAPTGMTTQATNEGGSPTSTSTEGPVAATGAAAKYVVMGFRQEMFTIGIVAWVIGSSL